MGSTLNCTFGGPDKRRLFITADKSLYSILRWTRKTGQLVKWESCS